MEQVRRLSHDPGMVKAMGPCSPPSSIDPTTLEDYHMSREDLEPIHMRRQDVTESYPVPHPHPPALTIPLRAPTHLPLDVTTKKNATPPSPSSSQGSPVTNKPRKRFQGPKLRTNHPVAPPRTTSFGDTSPTAAVTKVFSNSTGNLRDMSPPVHFPQRLSSSSNNSPVTTPVSAKSLPLPNIPISCQGRNSPFFHHPKPPSIDENSVYTGSNSSLTSQDLSPTLSIPSSISDEEPRFPTTNNQQSSPTREHARSNSDVGPNLLNKGPYQRSASTPDFNPCYINVEAADPVYINVSKKDDVYQNPPIFHPEHEPKNELPLPPRRQVTKPDLPPLPRYVYHT